MRLEKKQALTEFHRERILVTAQRLFAQKGIGGTTMDDVARDADYSKATLYVYYRSKEEIVAALTLQGMQRLRDIMESAVIHLGDWAERYDVVCRAMADFYDQTPAAFEITLQAVPHTENAPDRSEVWQGIYEEGEQLNDAVLKLLQQGVDAGVLRPDAATLNTVFLLWAALSGIIQMGARKVEYLQERLGLENTTNDFRCSGYRLLLKSILL